MRILVADAIDDAALEPLRADGHKVEVQPDLTAETVPQAVAASAVVVVRSTKVTAETIAAGHGLSLIVRAGAGVDNIDMVAASAAGVYVCNVPGRNAIAVAELTMGLILAIDRHIADGAADLRAGEWNKKQYSDANGLAGSVIGIIGLGDIGLAVAARAKAFGMAVVAVRRDGRSDAVQAQIRSVGIRLVDSDAELLAESDIVSLHVPGAEDTKGMVDGKFLASMKPGAMLINTARGDVVDGEALLAALDAGTVRAGLDVWPDEPKGGQAEWVSPLAQHPAVVGSHHIGASTEQAQQAVAEGTVEAIEAFAAGRPVNVVNLAPPSSASAVLTVRHLDQVGVLAQVFACLRARGVNVQHMSNQVFDGAPTAVATMNVGGSIPTDLVPELEAIEEVLAASLSAPQP